MKAAGVLQAAGVLPPQACLHVLLSAVINLLFSGLSACSVQMSRSSDVPLCKCICCESMYCCDQSEVSAGTCFRGLRTGSSGCQGLLSSTWCNHLLRKYGSRSLHLTLHAVTMHGNVQSVK